MSWATQADVEAAKVSAARLGGTTVAFEVPNIDGLEDGDLSGLEWVFGKLACIVDLQRAGRAHRLKGDIGAAMHVERILERHYRELPEWARW